MKFRKIILYTDIVLFTCYFEMKKKWIIVLCIVILIFIICLLVFNKWKNDVNNWNIEDWLWMVNEVSSYSVDVKQRWDFLWEDVYVYDDNGNLVLSLQDKDQPQYLFALYERYLVLDSGTSASSREMVVYDIPSWKIIYRTDYYPWENWLVLNDNNITFYKEIMKDLYWDYSLPSCESEYDNGYIENYWYVIWEDQANDLGDIQCAYFE